MRWWQFAGCVYEGVGLCVLLSNEAGTTSPDCSQESVEFNCAKTWGFCMKCEDFAEGMEAV
jgi:hypothetical protein